MTGVILEWFGYRSTDMSPDAAAVTNSKHCVHIGRDCAKQGKSGICSVSSGGENVPICPRRLYSNNHDFLKTIAQEVFSDLGVELGASDGRPVLSAWPVARGRAATSGLPQVGVFGENPFGGELSLPPAVPGAGSPKVDFTLFAIDPSGELLRFVPVEVQSIDTTGNTAASLAGLKAGRQIFTSTVGLNWENVNKRILPQLIVKGLMLQAEGKCTHGLYFVTPEPVYKKIMLRLGGFDASGQPRRLRSIPQQPGSLTFHRYEYDLSQPRVDGSPVPMSLLPPVTVSTSDLSLAFISPENLPASGAYEAQMRAKLRI